MKKEILQKGVTSAVTQISTEIKTGTKICRDKNQERIHIYISIHSQPELRNIYNSKWQLVDEYQLT